LHFNNTENTSLKGPEVFQDGCKAIGKNNPELQGKGRIMPAHNYGRSRGFYEFEAPRFRFKRYVKALRFFLAIGTSRIYPQDVFLVLIPVTY
jgi:hypothetical protein